MMIITNYQDCENSLFLPYHILYTFRLCTKIPDLCHSGMWVCVTHLPFMHLRKWALLHRNMCHYIARSLDKRFHKILIPYILIAETECALFTVFTLLCSRIEKLFEQNSEALGNILCITKKLVTYLFFYFWTAERARGDFVSQIFMAAMRRFHLATKE